MEPRERVPKVLEIRKIPFSQVPIDSKLLWVSVLKGIYDKRQIFTYLWSSYAQVRSLFFPNSFTRNWVTFFENYLKGES